MNNLNRLVLPVASVLWRFLIVIGITIYEFVDREFQKMSLGQP